MKIPAGLARKALVLKKNSPDILFVAGVVGAVGSTVLACRSTLKLSEVFETAQHDLNTAERISETKPDEYTEKDKQHDIMVIRIRTAVEITKLYAPSVILGVASIAALTKSHAILKDRNAALTAAYLVMERGFNEYRQRVADRYGEDTEREIRFPREKIKETNPETGREHTVEIVRDDGTSVYARWFDRRSPSWEPWADSNLIFLKSQQAYWNRILMAKGHVFLNEVYDGLGIPRTRAGQMVGWFNDGNGDDFIDFGFMDNDEKVRDFINGRENAILLDFNVDGLIFNKLEEPLRDRLVVDGWMNDERDELDG